MKVSQTITLIRFFLLNYSQRKNLVLLLIILLVGFFSSQFVSELSLINSVEAQFAFQIEFYRYGLVLLSSLILIVTIADDFSSRQFENLLSMPLARWQYIIAQIGAVAIINLVLVVCASVFLLPLVDINLILIWFGSMWLELMLVSFLALLAILSLEKIPSAMILLLSLYVLSRASPIILEIIKQSVYYSDGDTINQVILMMFQFITFVLPNSNVFVQNNLFYSLSTDDINLVQQALWVLLYALFITIVSMFDFYRKEFALSKS